jgi:serine/threonine-protein kinase
MPTETSAGSPHTIPDAGAASPPLPLTKFGEYDLLHMAGEGGMGMVFQARRRNSGEIVALKTMRAQAALSPELVQRFQREIRTADAVRHPNIVPVWEVDRVGDRLYYTMPFAPLNLARQRHAYREPKAAVELIAKVARALHHAHAQGVIHRDLKPANILLTEEGEPLIADFGLARWVDASQALTQTIDRMGTPAYMAPEQATGPSHELGGSADIWSLGVILYELLTGQRPFDADNQDALFYQIRSSNPPSPRSYRPELDPALEAIVLMCLRKDRAGRYGTAAAFAEDLERWTTGRPVRAQAGAAAPSPLMKSVPDRKASPRVRTAIFLGAAATLLFFGVRQFLPVRPTDDPVNKPVIADPQEIESALTELRNGRTAGFVRSGWPLKKEFLVGHEGAAPIDRDAAGDLQFSSDAYAIVGLVPDPQSDSYRIDARMWHDRAGDDASVGIAVACDQHWIDGKSYRNILVCHWNDLAAEDNAVRMNPLAVGGGTLAAKMIMFENGAIKDGVIVRGSGEPQFEPAAKTPEGKKWRRLTIEVRPDSVTAFFDGDKAPLVIQKPEINQALKLLIRNRGLKTIDPWPFRPQAAIGLVVSQSAVRIRSLTVTPLTEK